MTSTKVSNFNAGYLGGEAHGPHAVVKTAEDRQSKTNDRDPTATPDHRFCGVAPCLERLRFRGRRWQTRLRAKAPVSKTGQKSPSGVDNRRRRLGVAQLPRGCHLARQTAWLEAGQELTSINPAMAAAEVRLGDPETFWRLAGPRLISGRTSLPYGDPCMAQPCSLHRVCQGHWNCESGQ